MLRSLRWIAALVWLVIASPAAAVDKLNVVATSSDVAAIAAAVGGSRVAVVALAPGTADAHHLAAKPSMIRKARDADLLIAIGADLEIGWLPALLGAAGNPDIQPGGLGYLDLSAAVELLERPEGPVTRAIGDVHVHGNPHYWLDPRNGIRMARAIEARLRRFDPNGAGVYGESLRRFEADIERRYEDWRRRLGFLSGAATISYHKSWVYLADAFGFRVVTEVEPLPGIPPTAAHLERLVERIRRDRIPWLLIEPYYERRSSRYLEDKTGIRTVELPPSVGARPEIVSYADLFEAIVRQFEKSR